MDDIVKWDEAGDDTGAFKQNPWVRRVDDRNEPDPEKWLPGDQFGQVEDGEQRLLLWGTRTLGSQKERVPARKAAARCP
jgi:hypothetical protein